MAAQCRPRFLREDHPMSLESRTRASHGVVSEIRTRSRTSRRVHQKSAGGLFQAFMIWFAKDGRLSL